MAGWSGCLGPHQYCGEEGVRGCVFLVLCLTEAGNLLLKRYLPRLSFPNPLAKGHGLFLGWWSPFTIFFSSQPRIYKRLKNPSKFTVLLFPRVWRYIASLASHHLLEFLCRVPSFQLHQVGGKGGKMCVLHLVGAKLSLLNVTSALSKTHLVYLICCHLMVSHCNSTKL